MSNLTTADFLKRCEEDQALRQEFMNEPASTLKKYNLDPAELSIAVADDVSGGAAGSGSSTAGGAAAACE